MAYLNFSTTFSSVWEKESSLERNEVMLCGSIYISSLALFLKRIFQMFSRNENLQFTFTHDVWGSIDICICLYSWMYLPVLAYIYFVFEDAVKLILLFSLLTLLLASNNKMRGTPDFIINEVAKDTESIGAFWARQAYKSYFTNVLEDVKERMLLFEKKYSVQISLKSLVLIIPLSCDISGTFDNHKNIKYMDDLKAQEIDQGANINRIYKNPVYKIDKLNGETLYIAAECPNSLMTLWTLRNECPKDWIIYQRDCFVKILVDLVKDSPCTVLIYDEGKYQRSLSKFLIHEISSILKENVEVEFPEKFNKWDDSQI